MDDAKRVDLVEEVQVFRGDLPPERLVEVLVEDVVRVADVAVNGLEIRVVCGGLLA